MEFLHLEDSPPMKLDSMVSQMIMGAKVKDHYDKSTPTASSWTANLEQTEPQSANTNGASTGRETTGGQSAEAQGWGNAQQQTNDTADARGTPSQNADWPGNNDQQVQNADGWDNPAAEPTQNETTGGWDNGTSNQTQDHKHREWDNVAEQQSQNQSSTGWDTVMGVQGEGQNNSPTPLSDWSFQAAQSQANNNIGSPGPSEHQSTNNTDPALSISQQCSEYLQYHPGQLEQGFANYRQGFGGQWQTYGHQQQQPLAGPSNTTPQTVQESSRGWESVNDISEQQTRNDNSNGQGSHRQGGDTWGTEAASKSLDVNW